MPKTTTTSKTLPTTISVDPEVKKVVEAKREELTSVFGFKPTLGQTLTHLLVKNQPQREDA